MPTPEGEEASNSIPLALKHLFFKLQYSPTPVSTKDLIKSFGWNNMEAFVQQDVEELQLKLFDKLSEQMKGIEYPLNVFSYFWEQLAACKSAATL
jgi:ubiquitin carboxyl-terminal hydrolase 7